MREKQFEKGKNLGKIITREASAQGFVLGGNAFFGLFLLLKVIWRLCELNQTLEP